MWKFCFAGFVRVTRGIRRARRRISGATLNHTLRAGAADRATRVIFSYFVS
jgi:hypothetical protein